MAIEKKEIIEGIKTFFVVPDLSLMPEDFLPNFFLKGFEAYYLLDDQRLDIPTKIRVLFSLFPELILFFNTDRHLGNLDWPGYVGQLKETFGERARLGVLYGKHISDETRKQMEKTYLYDIGINCGCIPVTYRKASNLILLTGVLTANQANGRRKHLRAICGEGCGFDLEAESLRIGGSVLDISISHFSCDFGGQDPGIPINRKIDGIQLRLGGIICTVDAVLFVKRMVGQDLLHIFVFRNSRNREGLDPDMLGKVNGYIHERYERGVKALVEEGFEAVAAKKRKAKKPRALPGGQ